MNSELALKKKKEMKNSVSDLTFWGVYETASRNVTRQLLFMYLLRKQKHRNHNVIDPEKNS